MGSSRRGTSRSSCACGAALPLSCASRLPAIYGTTPSASRWGFFASTKSAHVGSPASWPTTSMTGAPIYLTKRRYAICCGNPAKSSKSSTSRERPGSRSTFPLTWSALRARYFRNCDGCQESARFDRRAGTLERCFGFPVHGVAARRRPAVCRRGGGERERVVEGERGELGGRRNL